MAENELSNQRNQYSVFRFLGANHMKKLFRKRAFAYFFDVLIFAFCFVGCQDYIDKFISFTGSIGYFIVFIPFFVRELLFCNASLGKKILGLIVVDCRWKTPNVFILIKRTFLMTTVGYILFLTNRDMMWFSEWEYMYLKTRVVEKKVYKALKEQSSVDGYLSIEFMNRLYDEYLIAAKM